MSIKKVPINYTTYFSLMRKRTSVKLEETLKLKEELEVKNRILYNNIKSNLKLYIDNHKVNLEEYKEFVENKYLDGTFFRIANGLYMNRKGDYKVVYELYELFSYAKNSKQLNDYDAEIVKCEKLLSLTRVQYNNILKTYYTEVHKQMILNGYGYSFGNRIGWTCVNRVIIKSKRAKLDFAATTKRKAELLAQGKKLYNKEEADWCEKNGIKYDGVDYRVYLNREYGYEFPLINSKLPNCNDLRLTITDYRGKSVRGKSNDELIEECNNDTTKLCELPVDLRTKVNMCDKTDKILYTKFIRNENQKSIIATKTNSKDRQ